MRAAGAAVAEASSQVWDTRTRSSPARGPHRAARPECGAGITATAIGDGETQRRSYPAFRGQFGTRGWELVRSLDLPGHAERIAAEARGCSPRRLPRGRDDAAARRRADVAADPRVGRPRHRAGPDPGLGGRVRRHLLAGPRPARLAPVRLGADEHHHRPDHPRGAGLLRVRRRGHARRRPGRRPQRRLGRRPGRARLGRRRRAGLRAAACARTASPGCRWCG